ALAVSRLTPVARAGRKLSIASEAALMWKKCRRLNMRDTIAGRPPTAEHTSVKTIGGSTPQADAPPTLADMTDGLFMPPQRAPSFRTKYHMRRIAKGGVRDFRQHIPTTRECKCAHRIAHIQ